MSDFKTKKSTSSSLKGEAPGKVSSFTTTSGESQIIKPKKAAAHRQVIADAANFQNIPINNTTTSSTTANDDYESGKVVRNKRANLDDDVNAVKNLPGLEGFDD